MQPLSMRAGRPISASRNAGMRPTLKSSRQKRTGSHRLPSLLSIPGRGRAATQRTTPGSGSIVVIRCIMAFRSWVRSRKQVSLDKIGIEVSRPIFLHAGSIDFPVRRALSIRHAAPSAYRHDLLSKSSGVAAQSGVVKPYSTSTPF